MALPLPRVGLYKPAEEDMKAILELQNSNEDDDNNFYDPDGHVDYDYE